MYGGDKEQEYEARNVGASVLVQSGLSLPAESSSSSRPSRFGVAEVSCGHLCKRLFLARA